MNMLEIIYLAFYLWMFFFGKVKIGENTNITLLQRAWVCMIGSTLLTILVGLPMLGILYLIGIK